MAGSEVTWRDGTLDRRSLNRGTDDLGRRRAGRTGVVIPQALPAAQRVLKVSGHKPSQFTGWLADKREEVLDLKTGSFTHLDDVVAVSRSKVRLTRLPEELVFISAKTTSRSVAP